MPRVAPKKPKGSSESSDWECSNCGATLSNVNNSEVALHENNQYGCICAAGIFVPTRNSPFVKPQTGAKAQNTNQGGGQSFPGP